MIPPRIREEDFRYELPADKELSAQKKQFEDRIYNVINKLNLTEYQVELNYSILGSILLRVDERKDYYKYFHSTDSQIMRISRGKEVALVAYWIVKYKPLRIIGIDNEERFFQNYKCSFNEVFAAMLIIAFVIEISKEHRNFFTVSKIRTLIYDLFNRDISKEAMIMYVESFVKDADS